MRILGIDYGRRRIGLALSDPLGWTAQGLPTLEVTTREAVFDEIAKIIASQGVTTLVLGNPLDRNGLKGRQASEVQGFRDALAARLKAKGISLPDIVMWDERFSSLEAERTLIEGDVSRAKRRERVDRVAASLILQSYLDHLRHLEEDHART